MSVHQSRRQPLVDPPWSTLTYLALGRSVLAFEAQRTQLAHRKVDSCEFIDHVTVRYHVSVDMTRPTALTSFTQSAIASTDEWLAPVALLRKAVLRNFNIADGNGAAVTVLTTTEHRKLGTSMIVNRAQSLLGKEHLATGLAHEIDRIVREEDWRTGRKLWRRFTSCQDAAAELKQQRAVLLNDSTFSWLLRNLAENFFLCALIQAKPGDRVLLKYEYETSVRLVRSVQPRTHWAKRNLRWLAQQLGLLPLRLRIGASVNESGSYHIELLPPDEVFCTVAELRAIRDEGKKTRMLGKERAVRRVHIHTVAAHSRESGMFDVSLLLRTDGFLAAAWLVSLLTVLLLAGGLVLHSEGVSTLPGGSGILALLPGLIGAYLFRPGAHRLVRRLGQGIRFLVGFLVVYSFLAAGLLTVHMAPGIRPAWWLSLTVPAVVIFCVISAAWLHSWLSERPGRQTGAL